MFRILSICSFLMPWLYLCHPGLPEPLRGVLPKRLNRWFPGLRVLLETRQPGVAGVREMPGGELS